MKTLKYWLSLLLTIILIAIPCAGVAYLAFAPDFDLGAFFSGNILFLAIGIVVWYLLFKGANTWFEKAKYEKNVDAFGMTSSFDYKHLSDKERKEYDRQRKEQMNRVLSDSTVRKATHPGAKDPAREMAGLSGMEEVKEKISEIVARANYDRVHGKTDGGFSSHYVFYGAPGTGKTTFARILTGFLYKNRIIRKNQCIEVDGNLLKASAPGEGGLKAEILVKNAIGGVLFIDEAYSMAEGYGNEAVDTLIKLMEDMRGQFVLILAGYTEPMANLLASNPGFRSRIKDYLKFPDYSTEEAEAILKSMAQKEGLSISRQGMENFRERYEAEKKSDDFGNARTVRNILDEAISRHALRISRNKKADASVLTSADISTEIRESI